MHRETIIIGAGPAGIQLGCFLQQGGFDYIIFEQNEMAGSFFDKFPHTGKLISINKKYTGFTHPNFNLRHDWNSLLSEKGPLFTSYSNEYYPNREDLVKYLHDFSVINNVAIQYNSKVLGITQIKSSLTYSITVLCNEIQTTYTCSKLIIASGLSPRIPKDIRIVSDRPEPIYHYSQFPKNYFKDEKVLETYTNRSLAIFGDGNSALELANHLVPYCSTIVIYGKARDYTKNSDNHSWSVSTNYTGDVRGVYLGFFDTFMLKSLNGTAHLPDSRFYYIERIKETNKLKIVVPNYLQDHSFDHIIYATGWEFNDSMFTLSKKIERIGNLPKITPEFESTSHPNLYFIGSLSHSLDFKKSSGGFIHGFRYMIHYFYQLHYIESFQEETILLKDDWITTFTEHLFEHLNKTSAMYQMHGVIGTIFYKSNDTMKIIYDVSTSLYHYTVHHKNPLLKVSSDDLLFIMTLEYGKVKNNLINRIGIQESSTGQEHLAKLLHPVLCVYKDHKLLEEFHFDEDLLAKFINPFVYTKRLIDILSSFFT